MDDSLHASVFCVALDSLLLHVVELIFLPRPAQGIMISSATWCTASKASSSISSRLHRGTSSPSSWANERLMVQWDGDEAPPFLLPFPPPFLGGRCFWSASREPRASTQNAFGADAWIPTAGITGDDSLSICSTWKTCLLCQSTKHDEEEERKRGEHGNAWMWKYKTLRRSSTLKNTMLHCHSFCHISTCNAIEHQLASTLTA